MTIFITDDKPSKEESEAAVKKGLRINAIIQHLKLEVQRINNGKQSWETKKEFDEDDLLLSLVFRSDEELSEIEKAMGFQRYSK